MSAEIHSPFGASLAPIPDEGLIHLCERLLRDAQDGTLLNLAVAGNTSNNNVIADYRGNGSANALVSAVSQLWFMVMKDRDAAA